MLNSDRSAWLNLRAIFAALLVTTLMLVSAVPAHAVLSAVGPTSGPSPPSHGFPLWYQDTNGLKLDACIPKNDAQLAATVCLISPPDVVPFQFPTNFPAEVFYWFARARVDMFGAPPTQAHKATLVLGLEAAFANGTVQAGDQITFGRTRIFIDAPAAGTYTVTHPYGVKTFNVQAPGTRAVSFTDDIGIAPGIFTGALQSGVGPFLRRALVPGGPAEPFVACPGDTSGDLFLSDGIAPVKITGSPFNTNYFKVCVEPNLPPTANNPGGGLDGAGGNCVTMEDFDLVGKLSTAPVVAGGLAVNSATFTRSAAGAQVDVSATATADPGAPAPVLSMGDPGGAMPSVLMTGPDPLGRFFGQSIPPIAATIPASVVVTNTTAVPLATVTKPVVDVVTIQQAVFDPLTSKLNITATTSDKLVPPVLTAIGLPGSLTGSDPLVLTPTVTDPAEQTLAFTATGGVPPTSVTVTSPLGGTSAAAVNAIAGGVFPAGAPVANNDFVQLKIGALTPPLSIPVNIPVFANDVDFVPSTIVITAKPKRGTAVFDPATGTVIYTYTGQKRPEKDNFRYTVSNATGLRSNVAIVTVTITP